MDAPGKHLGVKKVEVFSFGIGEGEAAGETEAARQQQSKRRGKKKRPQPGGQTIEGDVAIALHARTN